MNCIGGFVRNTKVVDGLYVTLHHNSHSRIFGVNTARSAHINNNTKQRTIPGILIAAPDRTLNNNGLDGEPNFESISSSTLWRDATIKSHNGDGNSCPHPVPVPPSMEVSARLLQYRSQHSVVIVKPGGTLNPNADISAKFAPLPPSTRFLSVISHLLFSSTAFFPKGEIGGYINPSSRPTCAMTVGDAEEVDDDDDLDVSVSAEVDEKRTDDNFDD
jgi:hypothetical protein